MGDVYAGCFAPDADGLVTSIDDERLCKPEAVALPARQDWIVLGSGWASYHVAIAARLPAPPLAADGTALPRAGAIARLAAREFAAGRVLDAALARPVYLRDKVALTLAEQRRR